MIVGKYYRNREEACISGGKGCGVIYLGGCNMHCVFCLEHAISQGGSGITYRPAELARLLLRLQEQGVSHISIADVEPSADETIEAIAIARGEGLTLPLLNNFNGYAPAALMEQLMPSFAGYVMDFKYESDLLARRLSGVSNYRESALQSLSLLSGYYGPNQIDENGLLRRGVLLRHLMLPGLLQNTRDVIELLSRSNPAGYPLDLMADFVPEYRTAGFLPPPYAISESEKEYMASYARSLGLTLIE